eukprot:gene8254-16974_t
MEFAEGTSHSNNNNNYSNGHSLRQYNIDSDSDSEDEAAAVVPVKSSLCSGYTSQIEEMNKLKEQSTTLLDGKWRENRNKQLLSKMLDLEEPTITAKMVEFLLQDGVCEVLLKFITHVEPDITKDNEKTNPSDIYKLSYKTTMLISPDEPSDALSAFLGKRSSTIARVLFDVFRDDFHGSFYHPYRILETLLRYYPSDVYDGITSDGRLEQRMSSMMRFIGHPPVADLLVMLVALTPVPRFSPLYAQSSRNRWTFFDGLAYHILILRLVETFIKPHELCHCTPTITPVDHSYAAAQALQDLIERLSMEDVGEILLQPIGHIPAISDMLVEAMTSSTSTSHPNVRIIAARLICFLLRRSCEEEFPTPAGPHIGPGGIVNTIVNRLHAQRHKFLRNIRIHVKKILMALESSTEIEVVCASTDSDDMLPITVKHPGHITPIPFTAYRLCLVETIVLLVESEEGESVCEEFTEETWRLLMLWMVEYPHTNIYHALFHRIIFTVIRRGFDGALKVLFQKAKFVNFLIDNFQLPSHLTSCQGSSSDNINAMNGGDDLDLNRSSTGDGDGDGDQGDNENVSSSSKDEHNRSYSSENESESVLCSNMINLSISSSDNNNNNNISGMNTIGTSTNKDTSSLDDSMVSVLSMGSCSGNGSNGNGSKSSRLSFKEGKPATVEEMHARDMIRGLLMNLCNILRLQMDSQPPTAYLRTFLSSHQKWSKFMADIRACTEHWQCFGMGIACPADTTAKVTTPMMTALMAFPDNG